MPKILHWLGLAACVALVISCFMPWAYYPDLHLNFTGFFSYQNEYGKPGVFLIFLAIPFFVFLLLPKVWAKRTNLFLGALEISYAAKTFFLFSSSYDGYHPERKAGIYLMLLSAIIMMLAAIFPAMELKKGEE